jgi:response regulator RpfG family c-di-GMP phosphodiesterase
MPKGDKNGSDKGMGRGQGSRLGSVIKLLLVTPTRKALGDFASALKTNDEVELLWAESGGNALAIAAETFVDLVVIDTVVGDMTGLDLAEKILSVNPMINCTVVSLLTSKEFNEASEGLGLLAQLPENPGKEHAEDLLLRIKNIKGRLAAI